MKHGVGHGTSQHQGTPTCRRLAAPRCTAGVVKMRRGLTAKYMAQLVSMREIYEAFDTWAAEIDAKSQRASPALLSLVLSPSAGSRTAQPLGPLCLRRQVATPLRTAFMGLAVNWT